MWSVNSVSPGEGWVADYNNIVWLSQGGQPTVGTEVSVEYEPAATLDMLLDYESNKSIYENNWNRENL
jgi:hypothetical protein